MSEPLTDATAAELTPDERRELDDLLAVALLPTFTAREREVARYVARVCLLPHHVARRVVQLSALPWQPIETAPKDGTPIFAAVAGESALAFYGRHSSSWCRLGAKQETHWSPTHWMPLPPPPDGSGDGA